MERTSTTSIKLARGLSAAIVAVNLVRAMTLPVTLGEAWNYDRFIGVPWKDALSHYDLNNHVLNTILVRISTARMHLTELSLRLPSLLGGLLYLWAAYRLANRRFGSGWAFLAVFALLTLNPPVLDAMSEARGYGMALAFFLWALELMLESAEQFSSQKFNLAAACLGLSAAASLAFSAPACALLIVYLGWGRGWIWPRGQGTTFVLIALLATFVFVAVPLDHPDPGAFLQGATSLRQTINELTELSVGRSSKVLTASARVGIGVLAAVGLAIALRWWRSRFDGLPVLTGGTLVLTLAILLAAHSKWHATFPQGGALYLVPLCTLLVASLLFKWNRRPAQIALYVAATVLACVYLYQLSFHSYAAGEEFAGGRALAKALRAEVGRRATRVGVTESAEPVINYYRTRYRQGNWERIERKPLERGKYEYYVLAGPDRALVEQWHLHVIFQQDGLVLAQ